MLNPKPSRIAAASVKIAILSGVAVISGCERKVAQQAAPPPEVEVIQVQQQDVPEVREWVATMDGLVNAQVRAQVSGYLLRQLYKSGDYVREGQPLFGIDARALQANVSEAKAGVDQAQSNLQQAITSLQNAQAQRGKTQLDVNRLRPLAEERAVSRQELDDAVQADLGAQAQIAGSQAAISAARSAIDAAKARLQTAELNVGFTNVTSPVSGIAGINNAQVGNLVGPQSDPLTTVSVVDPILVSFMVSEQEYLGMIKRVADAGINEQAALDKLVFTLQLTDGSTYPVKGKIHAVNREVDIRTGSIQVQTEFANPGNKLRPGGFGRISTVTGLDRGALLVPQRAVLDVQGQYFVAVVGKDDTVHIHPVALADTVGNMRVISKGLEPGSVVVAEGVQKVRDGIRVTTKAYQAGR